MLKRLQQLLLESDYPVLRFVGKFLQRYKQFLLGIVAGIVVTVIAVEAWDFLMNWRYSRDIDWEKYLEAPPFPQEVAVTYDWTIQTLDGQEFNMMDVQGKVVFLNFWATWCPPCIGEMPSIQRLYDTLKEEEGVVFVCVSDEESDTVRKFVEEKGYTLPIYTIEDERPEDFRGRGIPTTFIISKDGKITFRHIGSAKWDEQTSIDFIKKLL